MYSEYRCKLLDRLVGYHISKLKLDGSQIVKITHGDDHILILTTHGKLYTVIPEYTDYVHSMSIPDEVHQNNIIDIASGSQHNIVLTDQNRIYTWGSNTDGQGEYVGQCDVPSIDGTVTSITAGTYYSACVDSLGQGYVWGDDSDNQITDAITMSVKDIYSGGEGNLFCLTSDNTLISWGHKLANYSMNNVRDFYSGEYHHFVRFIDGTIRSIGVGGSNEKDTLVDDNIKQIAVGGELPGHTFILQNDGTLTGYGSNLYGQISSEERMSDRVKYTFKNKWKYISTGLSWAVGVTMDNRLVGWGVFGVDY